MRTEAWNQEREDLTKEMLPAVKKQAQQEVTSELRKKLRADVIEQQWKRMEEEGMI